MKLGGKTPLCLLLNFQNQCSLSLASIIKLSFPSKPYVSEYVTLGNIRGHVLSAVTLFTGHRDVQ